MAGRNRDTRVRTRSTGLDSLRTAAHNPRMDPVLLDFDYLKRKGEIAALKWAWIGEHTINLPSGFTKNKRAQTIPLMPLARQIIDDLPRTGDYVFPAGRTVPKGKAATHFKGFAKPVSELRLSAKVEHFTLHDLRRTFSTNMAAMNVPIHVTEKLLNHVSGTISGVAAVYNRFAYFEEMKTALISWEARLQQIIAT